ncbi:MAG: 3-deoxy-7-phosphoheptulonate synthase [candidate division KSB1 bacterium]|nr:3-deoxy-7-phosphoheptulonate synthase [candidate division KSB1 bacterium]MDZ7272826.1 3-deoxy-7-phosphoheptulonate synthase [candidate division KSB1 bacterium]MDZ7284151.1 3-deoxy-7-phosphoheptulonate synthase [candidate division KSB1 bacterium]MDZ7297451.1 3-deoxy-7-phosphoheptulonate synthase [candidate division KSB1 bacterium]MDZ7305587.1 3-deoxy-7-phosphoheptulonate synthase [candidate division KSB1 bacterium]
MVIVMKHHATHEQIQRVVRHIATLGYRAHLSQGEERTIIGVIGDERPIEPESFELLEGVERAVRILHPFKLASRDFHPDDSIVKINGLAIGDRQIIVMAGPCSVESREQLLETAAAVKQAGAHILRGGAFKPRTSPYAFQGLGLKGLELLQEAREAFHLPIITEVMSPPEVTLVAQYADILQIGARNMQNYALLHAVGEIQKPVLLKRGLMSTIEELLMAAEYILSHGNTRVLLCERGIRTFETATRNTFDVNALPVLKSLTHLPVIADPSHGTGHWELVTPIARAAIAAGADGLLVEVHHDPARALSDGAQSLKPENFARLLEQVRRVAQAVERSV